MMARNILLLALAWALPAQDADRHWAYVKPVRRDPPRVKDASWVRNPIDAFVLARLEAEGIRPSPEADRATLVKRLSYDLLGLPPEGASPDVEQMLASPHFGERWGRHWLDKARYADSDGYEKDNNRPDAWRYRNWVIDAVNADMPYDRFTIEQLAGDLLPDATPMQRLATAFHRQTLSNTEGGVDKEQFRVEAVFDRIETTSAVWLGLTVGCARCHNHKFDKISQAEYYRLFAFFNNGDEATTDVPVSPDAVAKYEQDKLAHDAQMKALQAKLAEEKPGIAAALPLWEEEFQAKLRAEAKDAIRFHPVEIVEMRATSEVSLKRLEDGSILVQGAEAATDRYTVTVKTAERSITGVRLEVLTDKALPAGGPGRAENGNFVLSELQAWIGAAAGVPIALHQASADFSQKDWLVKGAVDGEKKTGCGIAPQTGKNHQATFHAKTPAKPGEDGHLTFRLDQQHGERHTIGRFRFTVMTGTKPGMELAEEVRTILAVAPENRTAVQRDRLLDHYATVAPATAALAKQITALAQQAPKPPTMNVRVIAGARRATHVFRRGEFLQPLEQVQPGTLETFPPLKPRAAGTPDRLDLARWLMDPENPLTSRVAVNHIWAQLFGRGLVRTTNDFGVRGEKPVHPELLDWLAVEFVRLGWSRKAMIRLIVDSATYRQSSRHRMELIDRDPQNDLLHRQNRFRVEGEIVRDLALAAGGLLSRKIGGPSVFPPMPADVAALSYANNFKWNTSKGEDRYRRGMYTYFKRTAPHPNLATFDCPDSNTTCIERRLSNTPLQALTALNNEVFVEAAQAMARRVLESKQDRMAFAFRLALSRDPTALELGRLSRLLGESRAWYQAHPEEAKKAVGAYAPQGVEVAEAAAWTATVRVVLNLDEFLTRE